MYSYYKRIYIVQDADGCRLQMQAILILALDALLFGTEQLQFILKAQGQ